MSKALKKFASKILKSLSWYGKQNFVTTKQMNFLLNYLCLTFHVFLSNYSTSKLLMYDVEKLSTAQILELFKAYLR